MGRSHHNWVYKSVEREVPCFLHQHEYHVYSEQSFYIFEISVQVTAIQNLFINSEYYTINSICVVETTMASNSASFGWEITYPSNPTGKGFTTSKDIAAQIMALQPGYEHAYTENVTDMMENYKTDDGGWHKKAPCSLSSSKRTKRHGSQRPRWPPGGRISSKKMQAERSKQDTHTSLTSST